LGLTVPLGKERKTSRESIIQCTSNQGERIGDVCWEVISANSTVAVIYCGMMEIIFMRTDEDAIVSRASCLRAISDESSCLAGRE
jgi:hypothetical protein